MFGGICAFWQHEFRAQVRREKRCSPAVDVEKRDQRHDGVTGCQRCAGVVHGQLVRDLQRRQQHVAVPVTQSFGASCGTGGIEDGEGVCFVHDHVRHADVRVSGDDEVFIQGLPFIRSGARFFQHPHHVPDIRLKRQSKGLEAFPHKQDVVFGVLHGVQQIGFGQPEI